MAIRRYLAMTAAEMRSCTSFPENIGWMACHFSPYGLGLSNLPKALPPGTLLILDDITPIHAHDPRIIADQLAKCVDGLKCSGVLLDFQRPRIEGTAALTKYLSGTLPCPMAVTEFYADGLTCPVCLPPLPCHIPLDEYLAPWRGREIWLEMALEEEILTLTEKGCTIEPLPREEACEGGHIEKDLHCHYHVQAEEYSARFALFRTREDLDALLKEAEDFGVTTAVGLYQEMKALN